MVKELNTKEFENDTNQGVVIVDFWATWCGPCKMQSPVIEDLAETLKDDENANFFKVNVEENQELAQKLGIMSIPTLVVKKDGQIVDQIVGFHNQEQLEKIVKKYQ